MGSQLFSLRYRIIISVVLIETIMLSIMVFSNASQVRQTHRDRLDQSAQIILQQFTATAGRYLFEVDYPSLQEYADNILAHDELTYLLVEDNNGNLITASGVLPIVEPLKVGMDDPRSNIHAVHSDVDLVGTRRGAVQLGFSTSTMDQAVASALQRGALIAGVEIAISIVAALLIGAYLTRNLTQLARFAKRYGDGERDLTVPIKGRDETGMVAHAFNEMMRRREIAERQRNESEARQVALRKELIHASRLGAMGQLSTQIAHEINQPLAATMNYLHAGRQLIANRTDGALEQIAEIFDKAIKQTERTAAIIGEIRGHLSKEDADMDAEDVNEIVLESVDLAMVGVPDSFITLDYKLATDLPLAVLNRTQIQQVVVNLVRNAVEAMAESETRQLKIETSQSDAETVEICIGDTGPGIAAEVADRLFQRFVSTKMTGVGIGLSISYAFIEAHGGRLKAVRNHDSGTTFKFTLPIAYAERGRNVA
ncbi:MAG: HAMP domain-containing protein [Alphaproteobacteria bacterium]|nr:HAMP domain-containing protein [Alphaproteobacteria bacterium]